MERLPENKQKYGVRKNKRCHKKGMPHETCGIFCWCESIPCGHSVFTRIRSAEINFFIRINTDALIPPVTSRFLEADFVSHLNQFSDGIRRKSRFQIDCSGAGSFFSRRFRRTLMINSRSVAGFLFIHSKIDHVHQYLYLSDRLKSPSHHPKTHIWLSVSSNKCRDYCMKRAFVRSVCIVLSLLKRK